MSNRFLVLTLAAILLVFGAFLVPLRAQDGKRLDDRTYPAGLDVAFEWRYSCPSGKGCSFTCPGSGGGSNVTKLAMRLGTIPLSDSQRAFGVFYEFSSMQIPRANGFSITTGISTLSCQVQGMNLDYSGPIENTPTASLR